MFGAPDLDALAKTILESTFPALVMSVPEQEIVAASAAAIGLLSPGGGPVVGRRFGEFTLGDQSGALPLLVAGRLDGYEATHQLALSAEPVSVTVWVRRAEADDPPRHVVAILTVLESAPARLLPPSRPRPVPSVLGSTGPDLLVDRISCDVEQLVGVPVERILGQSLLGLVAPDCASRVLWGLAQATTDGTGAPLRVELQGHDGARVPAQLLIVPLHPPASCAFSILPSGPAGAADLAPADPHDLLAQLACGIDAVGTAREMAAITANRMVLSLLSARELDIVTRLLAGDRVPTIAKALFLAQSTVRNQLASVFTKTGVHSQQELLDLLRNQGGVSRRT